MPEGPEVINIAKQLHNLLIGKLLLSIKSGTIDSDKLDKLNKLKHKYTFTEVISIGKLLYFKLSRNDTHIVLLSSLGLTGSWKLNNANADANYIRAEIHFDGGILYMVDKMNIGKFSIETPASAAKKINTGKYPHELTLLEFTNKLMMKPKATVLAILMDQRIIGGIGNYLRSEIIYEAKISGFKKISELTTEEIKQLYNAAKKIFHKAILLNGSNNYSDIFGKRGKYYPAIYGRKTTTLGESVKVISISNRKFYYVD